MRLIDADKLENDIHKVLHNRHRTEVIKVSKDIEFQTEYCRDGKQYLVVTKRGRLARDDMCEVIRQYELARLRRASEPADQNSGYFK